MPHVSSVSGTSFTAGLVSEPENEGQAAETLLALAAPLHRSIGGSSNEPCFLVFHPDVPVHPTPASTPPPSPLRPHGSLLHSTSQFLRRAAEAAGSPAPVPVPQQAWGAGSLLLLSQHAASPPFMPLLPLPPLETRTAFQRESRGAEPPQEPKDEKAAGFSGAKRRDCLKLENKSKHKTKEKETSFPTSFLHTFEVCASTENLFRISWQQPHPQIAFLMSSGIKNENLSCSRTETLPGLECWVDRDCSPRMLHPD